MKIVNELLRTAKAPTRLTDKQARERASTIWRAIKSQGGAVSEGQLKAILGKHNMPFSAVGALFGAGYLKRQGKKTTVGPRGRGARGQRSRRPTRTTAKRSGME